jgi:hypothetical protein
MAKKIQLGIVIIALTFGGCCSRWWDATQTPNQIPPDQVVIISGRPVRANYFELGTVSSPGGPRTDPGANYRCMQRKAACLGAHAVILTDQMPADEPDFWRYPHTGVAIVYATSSL